MNLMEKYLKKMPAQAGGIPPIEAGKIAEICYWQDMVIPGCQKPCYHSDRSGNISECPHFRAYWAVRLTNINSKTVIQASDGDNAVT